MRRIRLTVIIASITLLALMVTGLTILIINNRLDLLDTIYEIIAFCIGIAGMLLSVISQIDAYRQERIISQLKNELDQLTKDADIQIKTERHIERQLDEIEKEISKPIRRRK